MRILIIHNAKLPVKLYGGTERMVWSLGKELSKMGHEPVFLVKSGSYCDFAKVIYTDENKSIIDQIPDDSIWHIFLQAKRYRPNTNTLRNHHSGQQK